MKLTPFHTPETPVGVRSRAKAVLLPSVNAHAYICVRSPRPYKALSTLCLTGNSPQPRRLLPLAIVQTPYTKAPPLRICRGGALVYPLGFEPKLDGVGGRNVIQLHYEYVFLIRFFQSYYILLFFACFLQAFMV